MRLTCEQHWLANRLEVLLQPDHRSQLVALHVCYRAGAAHEPPERSGLAHLCEHIAFTGAHRGALPRYPRVIQAAGGVTRGLVSYDRTGYATTLPAGALELGFFVEAHRMGGPATPASELVTTQKRVLLAERTQRRRQQADERAFESLSRMAYPGDCPYNRAPAGEPEGIAKISAADVRAFLASRYRTDEAVLAVAGNIRPRRALQAIQRTLGGLPRSASQPALQPSAPAWRPAHRAVQVEDCVARACCYVAFPVAGYRRDGWYAAGLVLRAAAIGKSSPLYRRLVVAERLAASVGARLVSQRYGSMAVFFAEVAPEIDPQPCSAALVAVLEEVAADGLDQGDLERARNKSLTDFYASAQRLDHRAEVLAVATAYGCEPQPLEAEEQYYRAVDLLTLRQWSRRHLDPSQRLSLTIVPLRES